MSRGIPALSQFPTYSAHPRPNGPGFAFWLQESIRTAQQHSLFTLQFELPQSKLLYNTEGSGRWVCQLQIHRYNSWSLCWHQDALAVPVLTCLPQLGWFGLSVSWWRGIQCLLYDSEEDSTQPSSQKCHWDPKCPLAFLWGCYFWGFLPCKSTRIICNEQASGEWRKGLNISAFFPVYGLVGIGAKISVAPSPLMLKGHCRVLWSTLTTQKSQGEKGGTCKRAHPISLPWTTACQHLPAPEQNPPRLQPKGCQWVTKPAGLLLCSQICPPVRWPTGCADFPSFPETLKHSSSCSFAANPLTPFSP